MEAHYNEPVSLFENRITMDTELQKEESMASKGRIRRPVLINGVETWITASTEQEYADKLITLALGSVTSNIPGQHNFREYAWMWFETYSKPNIAEVTAISYKRQLERHILPVLGDLNIEDIKPAHVQLVFNRIGSDAATQETKKKAKQVLSQIFKTAINDMLITRNPLSSKSVKIHGLASEKTKTYSIEQMRYLLEHVGEIKNEFDRAWLALITAVPLRPEEVLGLRWRDVDEE